MTAAVTRNDIDQILVKDASGEYTLVDETIGDLPTEVAAPSSLVTKSDQEYLVLASQIIKESAVRLTDEVLDRRLRNVLLAFLKEIRNDVQTHDALTKEVTVGGLGLTGPDADRLISLAKKSVSASAKKKVNSASAPAKVFTEEELEHEIAPPPPVLLSEEPKTISSVFGKLTDEEIKKKLALEVDLSKLDFGEPVKPSSPGPEASIKKPETVSFEKSSYPDKGVKPFIDDKKSAGESLVSKVKGLGSLIKTKSPVTAPSFQPTQVLKPKTKVAVPTGREKITDVSVPSRLVGPIEELRNLHLVDFRQLDPDPEKAILKIRGKIDLLEDESFVKKIAGIAAWRESEVNRLYLALGLESLGSGQPLEEVIKERKLREQPFLSKQEFLALGKLNKMLE